MPTPLTWPLAPSAPSAPADAPTSSRASGVAAATDYGVDVSSVPDLDDTFAPLTGLPLLAEHLMRALCDARFGVDLRLWLNDDLDGPRLHALQQAIEAQCLADERVVSAEVTVSQPTVTELRIAIEVEPATGASFAFVLKVTAVTLELLALES